MGKFNLTGQTYEFHEGRYRAKITLSTPDGRVTMMESVDLDSEALAKEFLNQTMDEILEDFKRRGIKALSRTELQTLEGVK